MKDMIVKHKKWAIALSVLVLCGAVKHVSAEMVLSKKYSVQRSATDIYVIPESSKHSQIPPKLKEQFRAASSPS